MKFNKKEKKIFWYGIAIGLGGGVLGSMFSSLFTELLINEAKNYWWGVYLIWGLFTLISILLIWLIYKININLDKLK